MPLRHRPFFRFQPAKTPALHGEERGGIEAASTEPVFAQEIMPGPGNPSLRREGWQYDMAERNASVVCNISWLLRASMPDDLGLAPTPKRYAKGSFANAGRQNRRPTTPVRKSGLFGPHRESVRRGCADGASGKHCCGAFRRLRRRCAAGRRSRGCSCPTPESAGFLSRAR